MEDQYQRLRHSNLWPSLSETLRCNEFRTTSVLVCLSAAAILFYLILGKISKRQGLKAMLRLSKPKKNYNNARYGEKARNACQFRGRWELSDFKRPPAAPYPNWSLETTKPLPYRPFRYGPNYHITMGLRNMKWDEWIELDNHYLRYHAEKEMRIDRCGFRCCRTDDDPRAFDAAVELLEELTAYLSERYPSMFEKTKNGVKNVATSQSFNAEELTVNGQKENPMQLCARLVQDDLDILLEGEDGQYYLRAAGDFLSGVERLGERMGMSISELHTSSGVPGFQKKLEKSIMSFFARLKPGTPMVRYNYSIQVDENLATSIYGYNDGPAIGWDMVKKNRAIEHHYFRTERQSLRRLPRSGAVVFTIRTYLHPITEIAEEPYVPGRLASAVRSWDRDVSIYKGREKYQQVLLEYLDRKHEKQLAEGLNTKSEDGNNYPW